MPRRNPARSVGAADIVRARVAAERAARGWSVAQLAARLTDVGCSIAPNAIWRMDAAGTNTRQGSSPKAAS